MCACVKFYFYFYSPECRRLRRGWWSEGSRWRSWRRRWTGWKMRSSVTSVWCSGSATSGKGYVYSYNISCCQNWWTCMLFFVKYVLWTFWNFLRNVLIETLPLVVNSDFPLIYNRQFEERELRSQQERAKKRLEFENQKFRLQNQIEFERSRDTIGNDFSQFYIAYE